MNIMKHKNTNITIQDYLELFHKSWMVEFDVSDFGASLSALFELPLQIYASQAKDFFLRFINELLRKASISFIQRKSKITAKNSINLALVGYWNQAQFAIPLWILDDVLFGFEILSEQNYKILDSFRLEYLSFDSSIINQYDVLDKEIYFSSLSNSLFNKNTIYFEIHQASISIANNLYSSELAFFERIANTIIPEIDSPLVDHDE